MERTACAWTHTLIHTELEQIFILDWELVDVWSCIDLVALLAKQADDQQIHSGEIQSTAFSNTFILIVFAIKVQYENKYNSNIQTLWYIYKCIISFLSNPVYQWLLILKNMCIFVGLCRQTDTDSLWAPWRGDVSGSLWVVHRRRLLRPFRLQRCHPAAVVLEWKAQQHWRAPRQ